MKHEIWGPAAGSTLMTIAPTDHGRVGINLGHDFSTTYGVFTYEGIEKMRDALNEILKDRK